MKIFVWSAPRWKFSRTPRRISSTPSNAENARPWPLLAVMPRAPQSSRGPGMTPASMAARTSRSRKFSSDITRLVVVPATRSRRMLAVASPAWGTGAGGLEDRRFALPDLEPVLPERVDDVRLVADDQGVRPRIGRRCDQRAQGLRAAIVLVGADDEAAFGNVQARLRLLAGDQARRV